jgi:protein-S-isoprenylcysteine O-methyltransferase Ste14
MNESPTVSLLKSMMHNVSVVVVGFVVAFIGSLIDRALGFRSIVAIPALALGILLLVLGFLLRVWATYHFYQNRLNVIVLHAQTTLITDGPYAISRNPLYLGGNVFIFFGAALTIGSPAALVVIAIHLPLLDLFVVRREERQLSGQFGTAWDEYNKRVRRWV